MTDLVNEQLSALIDGELAPEETALLLKRMEREPELARRYARYQAIGDSLRGERARARSHTDLARRICAAVADEPNTAPMAVAADATPTRASAPARRSRRFSALRPVAGFGLAAAVGALAVWLVARDPRGAAGSTVPQVASVSVPAAAAVSAAESPAVLPTPVEPASYVTPAAGPAQLRPISGATLANYVAAHARMSGALGGRDALIHLVADPAPEEMTQP